MPFQGLRMNRTLMSLTLTSNNIGDKGAAKIAEVTNLAHLCIYTALLSIVLEFFIIATLHYAQNPFRFMT